MRCARPRLIVVHSSAGMIRGTRSSGNGRSRTGPSPGPPASNVIPCCMKIASRRRPACDQRFGAERLQRLDERARVGSRLPVGSDQLVVEVLVQGGHGRCILDADRPPVDVRHSVELDQLERQVAAVDAREAQRVPRLAAPLGRRARVEDLKAVARTRAAGCANGRRRPRRASGKRRRIRASRPWLAPASWTIPIRTASKTTVRISGSRTISSCESTLPRTAWTGGPSALQLVQHAQLHEVAGVQDRVRARRCSTRQPAVAARHVRVGDHRDGQHSGAKLASPERP